MSSREFDIIIFGATGYTGMYVIEELAISERSSNLKWAIAGRNVEKLKQSLLVVQDYLEEGHDIQKTPIIKADVGDAESLANMCKRARLILNCVGPYNFYGEAVVSACINNGTHHVDLSGELKFLETMQAKYFQAAQEKKVYIMESCGFDSIPADYGISLLKKQFPGDLNSVEYFVSIGVGPSGRSTNIGTFASATHSIKDFLKQRQFDEMLKTSVFKKEMVDIKYSLCKRFPPLFYNSEVRGWCLWFVGPDERILKRSQQFRYEYLNERPVQSNGYIRLSNFFMGLLMMIFAGFFAVVSLIPYGSSLLTRFPSFFTAGVFSSEGPTRQQVLEGSTKFTLFGKGWKNKLSEPTDHHTTPPDTQMKLTITGPEPAYKFTAMCMVQAGLTVLHDSEKIPLEGGVLTPGVAFENTDLRRRLESRGVQFIFEIIE